jgi:YegS/Rv2252/BmrU family lipid kinase
MTKANSPKTAFDPATTAVVCNPTAGTPATRALARKLLEKLLARGYDIHISARAGHATELARQAALTGKRAVIAVGGDGTLCEIIADLPPDTALAYFPAGSGNNFALNFALPEDPDEWLTVLDRGSTRPMRFGLCNGRPFASVASVGFDAQLVKNVPFGLKQLLHKGAYVVQFLPTYLTYVAPRFEVKIDGADLGANVLGVIVGRGPYYGGPHKILPECEPDCPQLTYLVMRGNSKWRIGKFGVGMVTNKLPQMNGVTTGKAKTIQVETQPASFVQLDGDLYGTNPVTFSVEDEQRIILAP